MTPLSRFRALAAAAPGAPAILQGEVATTRAALLARAETLTAPLAARGVTGGSAVLLSAPNSAEVAALVLASWLRGGFPVFVSHHAPDDHVMVAQDRTHAPVTYAPTRDPDAAAGMLSDAGYPTPGQPQRPETIASIVFTSGSTGAPKGVMQSGATLVSGAERIGRTLDYGAEIILCPVPWSHDYGWGQLLSCLVLGLPLVLPETEGVQPMVAATQRHRPTVIAGTPAVFAAMAYGVSNIRTADLSHVRKLTSTGSHLPPELVRDLIPLFPNAQVYANYGLTETYRSACLQPADRAGRETSVGRAVEGVRLFVVDPVGRPLPAGEVGEVIHVGDGTFLGYVDDPAGTARTLREVALEDGRCTGLWSGDLGQLDTDGFLTLVGRRDRMIKSMDVRLSLDDVERRLTASGLVRGVAVVGVPHKVFGTKIVALVELKEGTSPAALKAHARTILNKYMQPRDWRFYDTLPQTPSGKTDYQGILRAEEAGPTHALAAPP